MIILLIHDYRYQLRPSPKVTNPFPVTRFNSGVLLALRSERGAHTAAQTKPGEGEAVDEKYRIDSKELNIVQILS
jgi:hypothetical protein